MQFPLKEVAANTIHGCQDTTFNEICIDMDILDSPGFPRTLT